MTEQVQGGETSQRLPEQARVLLVDDEENILRSLQRILRREPWELTTASSGEQALAAMAEHKYDLVISDARMPGMDGPPTLLAEIRRKYPPWCIRILLTGYADITSTIKPSTTARFIATSASPGTTMNCG